MYDVSSRPMTEAEARVIASRAAPDVASYGCIIVLLGVLPGYLLGSLGWWIGSISEPQAGVHGRWIGWMIAAIVCLLSLASLHGHARSRRARAAVDLERGLVQEVHVVASRVIEIHPSDENEPILAFDVGDGMILILRGQWLRDPETYGARRVKGDEMESFVNLLPSPYSFPSTEFVVSRFPYSGEVLGIRVQGEYLHPDIEIELPNSRIEFADSVLLAGRVDEVAEVLAREIELRQSR